MVFKCNKDSCGYEIKEKHISVISIKSTWNEDGWLYAVAQYARNDDQIHSNYILQILKRETCNEQFRPRYTKHRVGQG